MQCYVMMLQANLRRTNEHVYIKNQLNRKVLRLIVDQTARRDRPRNDRYWKSKWAPLVHSPPVNIGKSALHQQELIYTVIGP